MFIEMLDLLRCPVPHEETWLVASFGKMDARFVVEGKLGCPVCASTYEVTDGIARFAAKATRRDVSGLGDEAAFRYAAMLGITRPGSVAVVDGAASLVAGRIAALLESRIICLSPVDGLAESEVVGIVAAGDRIPLASRSVDGMIAVDDAQVADAARVLRRGARLVTPATIAVDGPFIERARDENFVVSEAVGEVVSLRRPG
jgi:uncharacterized protein YbaR (Trm112 family)